MKTIYFDSVQQVNDYYGVPTLHPMVGVLHLDQSELDKVSKFQVHYGIYAVWPKETKGCNLSYGRTPYDLPNVGYFADKCCLTPGYFGQLVKTETKRTARDFINDRLLVTAKEYLNDDLLTVNQISTKLGFEYPQHFVRFFKQHTGKTPSEYRNTV